MVEPPFAVGLTSAFFCTLVGFLFAIFPSVPVNADDRTEEPRERPITAIGTCRNIADAIGLLPNVTADRPASAYELSEFTKFSAACMRKLGIATNLLVNKKVLVHFTLSTSGERLLVANTDIWPLAIRTGSVANLASHVGEAEAAAGIRTATHNALDHCEDARCASNLLDAEYQQALSLVQRRARPLPLRLDNESSTPCDLGGDVVTQTDTLSFSYVLTSQLIAGYAVGSGCNHFPRVEFKGDVRNNVAFIDFGAPGSTKGHALALITDSEVYWQTLDSVSVPNMFRAPLRPVVMIDAVEPGEANAHSRK